MAAMTLNQLRPLLGSYIEPNGDFKSSLNQVLDRLHRSGTYRDLTIQYSLPVQSGHVVLPEEADSVLHTMVDGHPSPVRSLWHDYRSVGLNHNGADLLWGLIDAGYWPTKLLIDDATDTLHLVPAAESAATTAFSTSSGGTVSISATDGDKVYTSSTGVAVGDAVPLTFSEDITTIREIKFDGLTDIYDIRLDADDPETTIATIGPDSGVTRYRWFRLNRATDNVTTVHVLCKRAFKPLWDDEDVVYLTNIGALKHGLLGRLAEDNADLERADYHWQRAQLLLEEEMASSRGAAIPRLNVDPYGTSNRNNLYTIY